MSCHESPELSIVIGVLNGAAHVNACLERVYNQGLDVVTFEVLVVDGGSTDTTLDLVRRFVEGHGTTNLRILDNPRRTLAAAFNVAIPECRGRFLAKLDIQGRIGPHYYRTLLPSLREDPRIGLIGGSFTADGDTPLAKAWAPVFHDPVLVGPARYRYARTRTEIDAVAYGIYRLEAIRQVGVFDERILRAEDTDFNLRMRQLGWKIMLEPSVGSTYFVRRDLAAAFQQFQGYAYWRSFVRRKHGLAIGLRQVLPLLWLGIMIASLVGAAVLWNVYLLTPVLLYLLMAAVRAGRFARTRDPWHWLAAFALYPTLHAAYAIGTLRASLKPPGWARSSEFAPPNSA